MAVPDLTLSNMKVTADGSRLEFQDKTVYTDPARAAIALLWFGVYRALSGDVEIEFDPYSATEATKWYAKTYADGHHRLKLAAFNAVSAPVDANYVEGDVIYNTDAVELRQFTGGVWLPILVKDALVKALKVKEINEFPVPYNSLYLLDIQKVSLDDLFTINVNDYCAKTGTEIADRKYDLLYLRIEATLAEKCSGNWSLAQRNIEYLNKELP